MDNKIEKIIELKIDSENEENLDEYGEFGVEVISLVEDPAIEVDFHYFNSETCESCDLENRVSLSEEAQDAIIEYAINNGEDINENDLYFEFASLKDALKTGLVAGVVDALRKKLKGDPTKILKGEPKVYYRYTSASSAPAQRKFCKAMMQLSKQGRIFTEEQMARMETINSQFAPKGSSSYSIFEYSGGVNCVHYWQKIKVFKNEQGQKVIITSGPETDAELNAAKSQNERRPSQWGSINNNARLNFSMDYEARTVVGPVMIPDKFIIRKDEYGNPFYVYFTKETIKKLQEKFFKNSNHNKTDINHDGNIMGNNTLLESWIKEDEVHDKSLKYGFNEPIGTWFVSYKLSEETWKLVKEGKVNGFSLQGKFINELIESKDEKLLSKIKNILKNVEP